MRFILILCALVVFLPRETFAAEQIERGRAIAKANCSRCHAVGVTGKSPNPASPPFRALTKKYPLENLEEALAEGIVVGHGGLDMPRFEFSPGQIESLLAYMASIQRK
ncbi:cytochrome c [Methylosinus sporium]|uniref:Cytochrome c n=1 Tax=Methylosinus sporium TaxID=428 RepID=A0A549SQX1_METSR|nr:MULTISPECIES: cytochrome c [Methylosinus]MBU3890578.1 cytochrome c [Methylosinus sp. KRF6]TRL31989.1 cytochrome c [Methylosinus sporium]